MSYTKHLPGLRHSGDTLSHHLCRPAADAGIYFVEHHTGSKVVPFGCSTLDRQRYAAKLAAGGNLCQRFYRLSVIAAEEQLRLICAHFTAAVSGSDFCSKTGLLHAQLLQLSSYITGYFFCRLFSKSGKPLCLFMYPLLCCSSCLTQPIKISVTVFDKGKVILYFLIPFQYSLYRRTKFLFQTVKLIKTPLQSVKIAGVKIQ